MKKIREHQFQTLVEFGWNDPVYEVALSATNGLTIINQFLLRWEYWVLIRTGPILENKGMSAIFQKNGKEMLKKAKHLKIWAKMYKSENILKKGR